MNHEMPEEQNEVSFGDLSRIALEEAKQNIENEHINPGNIGILGQQLMAELTRKLTATEERRDKQTATELARYLADDLENNYRDMFPEEVVKPALQFLKDFQERE